MSSTHQLDLKKRSAVRERVRKRWDTLTDWARAQGGVLLKPLATVLGRLGVHPNTISLLGLMLQVGVGVVFGLGRLTLGGWLLLVVAPVDALDGLLARIRGKQSRFGAFLDSTLDRLSDAAVILGLTVHYMFQMDYLKVALLLTSLVAAMMVSYVRARAEAQGFSCKVGVLTRFERIVLIGVLSAFGLQTVMVWALAALSVFTVVQRILYVYKVSLQEERGS
jgi:CDP-diacylglycerol--glycerol-3-phosphate 3-phosphatidyltransferase